MACPQCGDLRSEVLKTVHRGRSMYHVRRCSFCKARFSTQERPVSWNHMNRKWPGLRPSRKDWLRHRMPGSVRELRGRLMRNRFQKGWSRSPRGPYCSGEAHSAAESGKSKPARKSSVHLRNLPRLQTAGGPQTVLGRQAGLLGDSPGAQFRSRSGGASACHL